MLSISYDELAGCSRPSQNYNLVDISQYSDSLHDESVYALATSVKIGVPKEFSGAPRLQCMAMPSWRTRTFEVMLGHSPKTVVIKMPEESRHFKNIVLVDKIVEIPTKY